MFQLLKDKFCAHNGHIQTLNFTVRANNLLLVKSGEISRMQFLVSGCQQTVQIGQGKPRSEASLGIYEAVLVFDTASSHS